MNRIDYVLTLTSGILKSTETGAIDILAHFSTLFEFNDLKKTGHVSLGARSDSGQEISFTHWIQSLRNEKIKNWQVLHATQQTEQLPAHIAAAFAGTQEYILKIETEKSARCYTLDTAFSPTYSITPTQLDLLIDAQAIKNQLWQLVVDLVNESNELNGRNAIEFNSIRDYFSGSEGSSLFNFLVPKLTEEIQLECFILDIPFVIPEQLKDLFYQSNFFFGGIEMEFVDLYTIKKVTSEELLALAKAQPFVEQIWQGCEKEFEHYPQPDTPFLPANEYEAFISGQSAEQLNNGMSGVVCRIICDLCEQTNTKPIIPSHLKECYGPSEKEAKKTQARSRLEKDKWHLKSNEQAWEMYFFELVSAVPPAVKYDLTKAKAEFAASLLEITTFAKQINSPFEEAFRLASYFLEGKTPQGLFDEQHLKEISIAIKKEGFSDRALEILHKNQFYLEEWLKMGFDNETILSLFSISNANMFGGMGSWNDQYIEHDHETYERLSAKVFNAMKNYFVVLISKQ